MLKRILLFIAVNILVLLTISITLSVLNIRPYINQYGIDYQSLLVFCAVVGFCGAFISLALSRVMAKFALGVQVIHPHSPASSNERDLLQTIYRIAQRAGLTVMPEVGIYQSPEVNAFATGPTKSRALVAVSSGLLEQMDAGAIEGVLAHEITHIANGDMVTMTLIQGVVNTFSMFLARVAAWAVSQALRDKDDDRGPSFFVQYMLVWVFDIFFSLLGAIVVMFFSRRREYRADAGGARVAGREKMVYALESLKRTTELVDPSHPSLSTLKINGRRPGLGALLASHPPLDSRIAALKAAA